MKGWFSLVLNLKEKVMKGGILAYIKNGFFRPLRLGSMVNSVRVM